MPTISISYGIVIAMFFTDREPAHYHARLDWQLAHELQPFRPIEPLP